MSNNDHDNKQTWVEEMEIAGNELVDRVKELMQQGNVRRIIIRKPDGEIVMEVPLTASVIAGSAMLVFAPVIAAVGAAAAFLMQVKLEVVRVVEDDDEKPKNDNAHHIDVE